MNSISPPIWLQTCLCLGAWAAGMLLHLKWHPQRQHLSDAWDLMTRMPWMVGSLAGVMLMAELTHLELLVVRWPAGQLWDWREMAAPLVVESAGSYLRSLHALFPSRPLAYAVPPVMALMVWQLFRWPYRYASTRPSPAEGILLGLGLLVAWGWLGMEVTHLFRSPPEALEAARGFLTLIVSAFAMAISQIILIRLVIDWAAPQEVDEQSAPSRAVTEAFARWRSVFALAALDLLWLAWTAAGAPGGARWIYWEALVVFAPLPVAVALAPPGPLLAQGALAMRMLLKIILSWASIALTAVAVLMFVQYASAVSQEVAGPASLGAMFLLPVRALVLAMVQCWLFLATVFLFLRHGLGLRHSTGGVD